MEIAILIYDRLTALDAIGPYEVLSRLPGASVTFVAAAPGPVRTDVGSLALHADRSLEELRHPDIVVVPGGPGQAALMRDEPTLAWLREAHDNAQWTASVCTGSLLLGAAGVLKDRRATTHWLALDQLAELGAEPTSERFVFDGDVVTAAGVSAGIDMALALVARIAGDDIARTIQLGIEYDPQPPFDSGSPEKAPPELVERLRAMSRFVTV
ncbi:MAG TPA: DJ-1/PfpI family protein [Solirubrobacteraceae bacterium]|jgi:transcriptional regulator GlxA family with amidase domain|nr:DJ-1/PfpI family protein [Solirubrobacteraceae bacterium]